MSYRCKVCRATVPHNQPRLLHVVKRPNGQITKEILVCVLCQRELEGGKPVRSLLRPAQPQSSAAVPAPAPLPVGGNK